MSNISYMNKILQAAHRRGEPDHYLSVLVLMAVQNVMRNATKTAHGRLWANVEYMLLREEIAVEATELAEGLKRLQRIGVIQLMDFASEPPFEYCSAQHASFTAKGLRKLRATGWGQYPAPRKDAAHV